MLYRFQLRIYHDLLEVQRAQRQDQQLELDYHAMRFLSYHDQQVWLSHRAAGRSKT